MGRDGKNSEKSGKTIWGSQGREFRGNRETDSRKIGGNNLGGGGRREGIKNGRKETKEKEKEECLVFVVFGKRMKETKEWKTKAICN